MPGPRCPSPILVGRPLPSAGSDLPASLAILQTCPVGGPKQPLTTTPNSVSSQEDRQSRGCFKGKSGGAASRLKTAGVMVQVLIWTAKSLLDLPVVTSHSSLSFTLQPHAPPLSPCPENCPLTLPHQSPVRDLCFGEAFSGHHRPRSHPPPLLPCLPVSILWACASILPFPCLFTNSLLDSPRNC